MTIVVLLVLVVVWAVVLVPSLLKRTAERRSSDSIGDFHRHLRVLQRTMPGAPELDQRMSAQGSSDASDTSAGQGNDGALASKPADPRASRAPSGRRTDPYFRPDACRRRRDVLLVLMIAVLGTGLIGAIPAARPMLMGTAVLVGALALYIVLLVRMRNRAVEREMKLRYLPPAMDREPAMVIRRAAVR